MDKLGKVPDNSEVGTEVIGGIHVDIPVNRNLSQVLFGQLKTLMDEDS